MRKSKQFDHQWASFKESFADLKLLKLKYDECVTKVTIIIGICPPNCLRYYLRMISFRSFYVLERCKLFQDGKCYRKYQYEIEEVDHLLPESSDRKISFVEAENKDTKSVLPRVKRLSCRSIAGIRYLNKLSGTQSLEVTNIAREVDSMLIETYQSFEADVFNSLYNREGINRNLQLKCRQSLLIDVKFTEKYFNKHKTDLPAVHREKGVESPGGIIIWCTSEPKDFQCFTNKWNSLIIDGQVPCPLASDSDAIVFDHDAALRTLQSEDSSSNSRDNNSIMNSKPSSSNAVNASSISSVNAEMGLGSRRLSKGPRKSSATTTASACLAHTPDADRLTKSASVSTPFDVDSVNTDSSPVILGKRSRAKKKLYNDVDYNNWVADSDEDLPISGQKNKRVSPDTDEYEITSNSSAVELHKSSSSSSKKKNRQHALQTTIANRLQQKGNDDGEVRISMYKRASLDGADLDFIGDIQADLCDQSVSDAVTVFSCPSACSTSMERESHSTSISSELGVATTYSALTPSARAAMNVELDESFIMFLVCHTTSEIGAEIALELCIVNYIMRKELLNGVSSREKQIITNWNDIFVSIETLIINKINRESNGKRNIIETACMGSIDKCTQEREDSIRRLDDQSDTKPESEHLASVRSIEETYDKQILKLKQQLKLLVGEIERAEISVLRKVVRTLFNVAKRVCYMWMQFNDCLSLLTTEQRDKYARIYADRDNLQKNLKFAEVNRLLYLQSEKENSNDNSMEGNDILTSSTAVSADGVSNDEQRRIRRMLEKNHVQELEQVIRAIKVDKDNMKDLVSNIMWVKMPRNCTSIAKALSSSKASPAGKKVKGKSLDDSVSKDGATMLPVEQPSAASVANMAKFLNLQGKSPSLTDGTAETVEQETINQQNCDFAKFYDNVIRTLMLELQASSEDLRMHLHYRYKSGRTEMIFRLRFLQFLVSHRDLPPQELILLFSESAYYGIFNCIMFIKAVRADGNNIRSDGYCFYRSIYQLYMRELSGYERSVDTMVDDDRQCNTEVQTDSHAIFLDFMTGLSHHIKAETSAIRKMFPVQHFKFLADQRVLPKLLKMRPGHGITASLYGNQADVYMLKFNVNGWELDDKDSQWMRYINCSADTTYDTLKLEMVDRLRTIIPNFVCYQRNHFFVVESPSLEHFAASIDTVKERLFTRLMEGVALIPEPELFLKRLDAVIEALEDGGSPPEDVVPVPFDFTQFSDVYCTRYAHDQNRLLVDLMSDSQSGREISTEVSDLKEKLRVSMEKAGILDYHVKLLAELIY